MGSYLRIVSKKKKKDGKAVGKIAIYFDKNLTGKDFFSAIEAVLYSRKEYKFRIIMDQQDKVY